MELVIYSPKENEPLESVSFNYEELKEELALRLEKYNDLVYSEGSIKEAKADRATLNKFKAALEARRIEIKKQCMAPYEEFEKKVKDLVAMVDKPILAIDQQVKEYERIKKEEKETAIKQFYTDKVADLESLVPFEKAFNPRWLNVSYKETDIQKEITDLFIKVEDDLAVITELQSEYELQIKDVYLREFDLTAALQEKKRLEEQAAKMAEYKRAQQEREQAQRERDLAQQEPEQKPQQKPEQRIDAVKKAISPREMEEEQIIMDFRVWATQEQLKNLSVFLQINGIKYGRVPTQEREAI